MKLILSRAVVDASAATGQHITGIICAGAGVALPPQPCSQEVIDMTIASAAGLKNVHISELPLTGEIVYEIDDKVLFAIFRVYEKVATAIGTLVSIAKPLLSMVKVNTDEVQLLLNERV